MKTVYKLMTHFKVQTASIYVKAAGAQQAIDHVQKMYPTAKVEFIAQVDFQHSFDIEV